MQSSVRLRHMVSALRLSWRSMADGGAGVPLEPDPAAALCVILAIVNAPVETASSDWYTSGATQSLALAKADWSRGWGVLSSAPTALDATGDALVLRARFGEEDMVVTVVVAVWGRSPTAPFTPAMPPPLACVVPDTVPFGALPILPVTSSFRMRDLRSSSSSHTVDGAVVETVDSVPCRSGGDGSCSYELLRLVVMGEE